jgi:hypothetical protein
MSGETKRLDISDLTKGKTRKLSDPSFPTDHDPTQAWSLHEGQISKPSFSEKLGETDQFAVLTEIKKRFSESDIAGSMIYEGDTKFLLITNNKYIEMIRHSLVKIRIPAEIDWTVKTYVAAMTAGLSNPESGQNFINAFTNHFEGAFGIKGKADMNVPSDSIDGQKAFDRSKKLNYSSIKAAYFNPHIMVGRELKNSLASCFVLGPLLSKEDIQFNKVQYTLHQQPIIFWGPDYNVVESMIYKVF